MSRAAFVTLLFVLLNAIPGDDADDGEEAGGEETGFEEEEMLTVGQLGALHSKIDENRDGKLSIKEVDDFAKSVSHATTMKDLDSILESMDSTKDGELTLAEHLSDVHAEAEDGGEEQMAQLEHRKTVETAKFKAADVNGDGNLDKREMAAMYYPETNEDVFTLTVQESMRQKDVDKNGKLSHKELLDGDDADLSEHEEAEFAKLDADRSGFIDVHELRNWESTHYNTLSSIERFFKHADKDGDKHIDAEEFSDGEAITASDAHYHLIEWAKHHEL